MPKPKIVFPLTGSTFEGRQEVLSKACDLWVSTRHMSNYNNGLALVAESGNSYDPFAVKVLAATTITPEGMKDLLQVGYVPKRWCPSCGEFMQVRNRGTNTCTNCGAYNEEDKSTLNKYLVETFFEKNIPVATFVVWAGRGQVPNNNSWGMRIGLWWP